MMLAREGEAVSPADSGTGGHIFVSVEMSRSKWVIGLHTPMADKIGLHTVACGDVDAILDLPGEWTQNCGELGTSSSATRRDMKASGSIAD